MFLRGPTKIVLPRLAYVKCELGLALAYAREHLASDALPPDDIAACAAFLLHSKDWAGMNLD